jgi:hypothetical protein
MSELSRLDRSVGEMITMVDRLETQQSHVFALQEGLRLQTASEFCLHQWGV